MGTVVEGLWRALDASEETHGVSTQLIMCFLRDESAESALETLEAAKPYLDRIVGDRARLGRGRASAGRSSARCTRRPPRSGCGGWRTRGRRGRRRTSPRPSTSSASSAIDHGLRCMEDPELVERLVRDRIPLTLCPLSNVRLRAVDILAEHPLPAMLDAGLLCTVNSDDPAYFGGYAGDNFDAVRQALGLGEDRLRELARNSFVASFLEHDEERRARYLAEVDAYEFDVGRVRRRAR